jgi:hypothetical protein
MKTALKTGLMFCQDHNYRFTAPGSYDNFPSVPLGGWGLLPGCRHRVAYHFEEVIRRWRYRKSKSREL